MNMIAAATAGAAALAFGPAFLVQAAVGYVAGTFAGAYCESRMKKLHCEISRHTGNNESEINDLGKYVVKASQLGGVICPVIPLVSVGVGMYCSKKANGLADAGCPSSSSACVPAYVSNGRGVVKAGGRI